MSSQAVADSIPQLVQGMRSSQAQPEELGPQLALIMASQSFLQVSMSPLQNQSPSTPAPQVTRFKHCFCCSFSQFLFLFLSPSVSREVRW